jgi:hypothetical protein
MIKVFKNSTNNIWLKKNLKKKKKSINQQIKIRDQIKSTI